MQTCFYQGKRVFKLWFIIKEDAKFCIFGGYQLVRKNINRYKQTLDSKMKEVFTNYWNWLVTPWKHTGIISSSISNPVNFNVFVVFFLV